MPEPRRTRAAHPRQKELQALLTELTAIRATMVEEAAASQSLLDDVHPNYRDSARNLLHYLALRRQDLRSLQLRLAALGLSSLGRAESHVLPAIDAVLDTLARLEHVAHDDLVAVVVREIAERRLQGSPGEPAPATLAA